MCIRDRPYPVPPPTGADHRWARTVSDPHLVAHAQRDWDCRGQLPRTALPAQWLSLIHISEPTRH
eukprot:65209-Karenia_brevis.AAC.1